MFMRGKIIEKKHVYITEIWSKYRQNVVLYYQFCTKMVGEEKKTNKHQTQTLIIY